MTELEAHKDDVNYEVAIAREKEVRHDVMSHVYAYGVQCPKAKGIIHLGATSCYVGDNTDVILMRRLCSWSGASWLNPCWRLLARVCRRSTRICPALAYTHLPARPADHRRQARHPVDERAATWTLE